MRPTEPNTRSLAPTWRAITYAQNQQDVYIPLPTLQEQHKLAGDVALIGEELARPYPWRVVSVWEPTDEEMILLGRQIRAWLDRAERPNDPALRGAPRPRVSLMQHTFGQALQPVRVVIGEFSEPYATGADSSDSAPDSSVKRETAEPERS